MRLIINNAEVVNEGKLEKLSILVEGELIADISTVPFDKKSDDDIVINAEGKYLMPGMIDTHVHFREPGLTYKADMNSESRAAVAGGVTSIVDMPNTSPATTTWETLNQKYELAAKSCLTNYSFYIGATNNNIDAILDIDPRELFGVKVFMGSSTGDMLVNNNIAIEKLFRNAHVPISTHCEDEAIIRDNIARYKAMYPNGDAPTSIHAEVRNRESCLKSTSQAVMWAQEYGTRLNILHISTADEIEFLRENKTENITAEACVGHLFFSDINYKIKGNLIKCNPSIKTENDRMALLDAINDGIIDIISTDHAPHTLEEKQKPYFEAPSGMPTIQHSLQIMLQFNLLGILPLDCIVEKMCHAPAKIFNISKRGFIRKGYYADMVMCSSNKGVDVDRSQIMYKCKWSPIEDNSFYSTIDMTVVNGKIVFENGKIVDENHRGKKLELER